MTGFIHVHLPLVSDYLQVLSTQQDLLASIYHSSVITRDYKSARQELLACIFKSSEITCVQCTSRVTRAQHASYLQIFWRHEALLAFFVNLDVSCTVSNVHIASFLMAKILLQFLI